jgi:signal transduction histidine kinase
MVTITDNGVGFETGLNAADSYGLQNIRKRAAESNISLSLKTSIDQGTEYLLIV